ncbi:Multidrug resistance protein MdtA precursor [Pseudodesulfovibrio hydrargyri]|uniref:Multidrug resistance protein MdtA n=1 Tax=Pseudodesulfovibrio hydrargyri TaxID=2125990 RepID=A0A1J5N0R3_9BACT|nr:efflux RND transporter periplasmic adaptor subunit [Pseudodesulfovibrio hydrargyri]OIQ51708.1 Multidrug resistance protein MdtA precursor [Pseudodesulfovibrio hydrargyri]
MNLYFNKIRAVFRLKLLVPLAIVLASGAGSYLIMVSAPKAKMRPPQVIRQSVETRQAALANHRVVVDVMGTVTAAREIDLKSQVSGKVVEVSPDFVPGGFFQAGEPILNIDAKDYELAVREVEAQVTEAEYDLKVEQGYQKVSAREWALLQEAGNATQAETDLALRKPHLAKAQADLRAARAKLEQARIDLSRTRIAAPFAAMVESKDTDLGAAVAVQGGLATLVGTDEFWIQASVPVDRLGWINLPSAVRPEGSTARIISGSGADESVRKGRVVRLLPSLEDEGRMARVLIAVKDPLNLEGRAGVKPLLLGSYVSVRIEGNELTDVIAVPRTAFRDNSRVWVLAGDGTLDIRTVDPVWKDEESIVIREGLAPGERIVMTDLAAPVQGMLLTGVDDGSGAAAQSVPQSAGTTTGEADNG